MDIMENVQMEVMNMDISERLQELRKKEGYSQEQVAEMLGLSRQAISKWESGQGKPEIDNLIKLTEIYTAIILTDNQLPFFSATTKHGKNELQTLEQAKQHAINEQKRRKFNGQLIEICF